MNVAQTDVADFENRTFTFEEKTKRVLFTGRTGPAVIIIHEIYGFTPAVARLCRWVRDAGFRVYAPILFGRADASNEEKQIFGRFIGLCISREFTIFAAGKSSPVVDWLKLLAGKAHQDCGGKGVGVVGLCLTGGFALSMAVDSTVMAPVMGEPSLPAFRPAGLDISPEGIDRVRERIASEGLNIRGYRFHGDRLCKEERFAALRKMFGNAFVGKELPNSAGNPNGLIAKGKPPHSVFTGDLIDQANQPTRKAVDEIIAFFRKAL